MSTYVMSDIHGRYDRYLKMLDFINFSDKDKLYIIGDVIDYGSFSIQLLNDIMKRDNVEMTMGDHEYMMIKSLYKDIDIPHYQWEGMYKDWINRGGDETIKALFKLSNIQRNDIFEYVDSLLMSAMVNINDEVFYLVHAYPQLNIPDMLFTRIDLSMWNPVMGTTLIVGHTPTPKLHGHFSKSYNKYHLTHEYYEIEKAPGFINIDCGCEYINDPKSRLGCLRLDDMKEFYVK